jgi:circadian clock protein KaiC
LHLVTVRPSNLGLEAHLASIHQIVKKVGPTLAVIDPLTNFLTQGDDAGVKSMLTRLVDFLKMNQVTSMFTNLTNSGGVLEATQEKVSSIMDAWLLLRDIERDGKRSYAIYLLKSRGMAHSHEMHEFRLADDGIHVGPTCTKASDPANSQHATQSSDAAASFGGKS